ncbi:MAG: zinc ABC transporter substrate-binding protein [Eubacteriales bacterium]|nr:zinc ABC transporter substrate-binding protein [Eubacteriales bacterium]
MWKKYVLLFCAFCLLLSSVAQAQENQIAVTILPLQAFADKITGGTIPVMVAVPQGASPESYEPSPKEMESLSKASVYFSIGMPAEAIKITPFLQENTKIVNLAQLVSANYPDLEINHERDPHIWLSIARSKFMVQTMCETLVEIYPNQKEVFEKNTAAFLQELDALDSYIKTSLKGIKDNKFIAFHPAFQYFAEEYGLEMFSLEEHGHEATVRQLEMRLQLAKEKNIKVIFIQDEISSRQATAFADAVGGKVLKLSPLAYEYVNNMKAMTDVLAEVLK